MSDNGERPDPENESRTEDQTRPERRHGAGNENSDPGWAHGSQPGGGKDPGEYPSSAGSDESPQEPVTEESSAAPKPGTTSGTSDKNNDEPANSPYSGEDSPGADENGQDESMEGYPSTAGVDNNEDDAGQNNDSEKRDPA